MHVQFNKRVTYVLLYVFDFKYSVTVEFVFRSFISWLVT